jgi:hypothetical protein
MTPACFGCNVQVTACLGYIRRNIVPDSQCPGSCDYAGVYCGAPDGCGGVCVSSQLCPLFLLRPDLASVLLAF